MTEPTHDIHKAALIIIEGRKVLATRTRGQHIFVQPGGKLEQGETEIDAAIREANEELGIALQPEDLIKMGDYYAEAAYQPDKVLKLTAFIISKYNGQIAPHAEVEEIRYFSSQVPENVELASIFTHDILPALKAQNLID